MPLIEEKFDQHKIDSLKRYLQRERDKGRAKDYEIIVDGFRVVSRTDDLSEFEDYEDEVKNSTRSISILVYNGDSQRNTNYTFWLNADGAVPALNGFSGLGSVDQLIQQRLDEKEKDYKIQSLQEKLDGKQAELDEAAEYQQLLEQEIEQLKANKYNFGGADIGTIGGEIVKYLIGKKAEKSPLAAQLSGILGALSSPDAALPPAELPPQGEATFQEKCESNPVADSIRKMQAVLNGEQLHAMNYIMVRLMEDPEQLPVIAELLNNQNK